MDKKKLIMGAIGVGLIAVGGVAGALAFPQTVTETVEIEVDKIVTQMEYVDVPVNVTVEVPVEVEVPVDNGNLAIVLEHIYDNEGQIEYLLDDLDDDELDLIVERVAFINEIKAFAINAVESELFDEIDGEEIVLGDNSTYEFDEDDLSHLDIDDDMDELIIEDIDFEDGDAEILVSFDFEDEDELEFEGTCIVKFKDGEFDELQDIEIVEKE